MNYLSSVIMISSEWLQNYAYLNNSYIIGPGIIYSYVLNEAHM